MQLRITTIRTGRCLLAYQGGGSHLSTRHTVDGIVDEYDDNILATVQCVDGLAGSDTSQVTIALIGKHQSVRPTALDTCSQGWCPSMGSLLPVDVNIVIGKHGAPYGTDAYSLVLHSHFLNDLGNELVHHAMRTAWAVVHIIVVHQRRLLADNILGLYYLISIHSLTSI